MEMKRVAGCLMLAAGAFALMAFGEKRLSMKSNVEDIDFFEDGRRAPGGWRISPELNPDKYETMAKTIVFASDVDTLRIELERFQQKSFDIITANGDTAHVLVTRISENPYEFPDPALTKLAVSRKLSKEQAAFDIRALIYNLDQIHPDIFSVCRQEDLLGAVNKTIKGLPDSISIPDLYLRTAPIVAMIGDGHTNLGFPFNDLFTRELKRLPLYMDIASDKTAVCSSCIDSVIKPGEKILSINGKSMESILDSMLPYVSGERVHFKLSRVNHVFTALWEMLYPAETYDVAYLPNGSKRPKTVVLQASTWDEINKRMPKRKAEKAPEDYSFMIDPKKNVAVMDFRSFDNPDKMKVFADSMFRTLREKKIGNLIIDVRNNGGGNSRVGDVLLQYISPVPFNQMPKALVKVTPVSSRLMGGGATPQLTLYDDEKADYFQPLTKEEGHYDGNVYLLTSNNTFSSAGSFAWAFKECGIGKVIGEETGGMNVCYGDVLSYRLPVSGMYCSVSYKRFWQMNADENDIHGTLPDIAVPASKAMDAALKEIEN